MCTIALMEAFLKYFVIPTLTAIVAGFGAYFGAYLKKKGENWATHQDIEDLKGQTAILTQTTEAIKATISIDVWSHQQRWDAQKTALLESLKALADADTFLWRLVHAFSSTREMAMDVRNQHRTEADQKYVEAMNVFWRTKLAVEIVCGRAIADQFQRIDQTLTLVRRRLTQGDYSDIWENQYTEMQAAKRELGQIIRQQLGFDLQLGGGELSLSSSITPRSNESSAVPSPGSPAPGAST